MHSSCITSTLFFRAVRLSSKAWGNLQACGDHEALACEEAALLLLEHAYREALKLLKYALAMGTGTETIQ